MNIPTYVSGAIFAKAYKVLRTAVNDALRVHRITPTEWALLGTVATSINGIRLVEVAEQLGVKAPLVTAMVNQLLGRDLLIRAAHQFDGRAKLLMITPYGKKFMGEVEQDVERNLNVLLSGLTEQDLLTYKKVLDTIIQNAPSL